MKKVISNTIRKLKNLFKAIKFKVFELIATIRHRLGRAAILLGRIKHAIYLKKVNGKRRIVVSEKYTKVVKSVLRIILAISIVLSFVAIPAPWSTVVSLALIALEQLLERVGFYYSSLLIVDFPPWDIWRKAGFTAMIFGRGEEDEDPFLVGMAFSDETSARTVWDYIAGWAIDAEDVKDNLKVSIVINKKAGSYAVFVYPSYGRESGKALKERLESEDGNKEKDHRAFQAQMMIIKVFPLRQNSSLVTLLLPYYKSGKEYQLRPFLYKAGGVRSISETQAITKTHLKIMNVDEVTHKDMEYHSVKYDINWRKDSADIPQSFYYGRENAKKLRR